MTIYKIVKQPIMMYNFLKKNLVNKPKYHPESNTCNQMLHVMQGIAPTANTCSEYYNKQAVHHT